MIIVQSDQIKITYLDASTVDIYSNCQLVIIIIDPRQVLFIYNRNHQLII